MRLGHAKQLVQYKGRSLLRKAVDVAGSLSPLEIIVVTGSQATAVKKTLQGVSVKCVDNPQWSAGMGGSISAGATTINPEATGLMILLAWAISRYAEVSGARLLGSLFDRVMLKLRLLVPASLAMTQK